MREPFRDLPRRAQIFTIAIVLSYFAGAGWALFHSRFVVVALLVPIFAAAGLVKPVPHPLGGISDSNTGLLIVAALLWVPPELLLGVGVGAFLGLVVFRKNEVWRSAINGAGWSLGVAVAALVAHQTISIVSPGLLSLAVGGIVAAATYRIINTGIFAVWRSWRFEHPFLSDWRQAIVQNWPGQILPAALAVALSAVAERTATLESRLLLTAVCAISLPFTRKEYEYYIRAEQMRDETVEAIVRALEGVDPAARGHGDRVSTLSTETGRRLGMPLQTLLALRLASRLHDVGLLAGEEGPFEEEHHTEVGSRILARFPDPMIAEIVRAHHERWDGKGVPDHRRGDAIPLGARILAAAEIYDSAVEGLSPFEAALPYQAAMSHLISLAGSVLDPRVVMVLIWVATEQRTGGAAAG